ncbi:hypothetical protein SEA_ROSAASANTEWAA_43 [Streptomyces phage RosaAsantewaa]|nr:hypothetical protein SEA_ROSAASANTEWAA_43 [Streptomyces phage RosaAsantewaa]
MAGHEENVLLEDARIIFRNFAGNETQYNPAGRRNFSVVLTPEVADKLEKEGWNVKRKPPREEGDDELCHLPVTVSFKGIPPRLYMITKSKKRRTMLDEETAELLDYAELELVDVIIRPYDWEVNGNTGRKAYVKTLYATIREDELDLKYADVQDDGQTPRIPDDDEGGDLE